MIMKQEERYLIQFLIKVDKTKKVAISIHPEKNQTPQKVIRGENSNELRENF